MMSVKPRTWAIVVSVAPVIVIVIAGVGIHYPVPPWPPYFTGSPASTAL